MALYTHTCYIQDNFGLRSSVDIASANVDIEIARDQDDSTRKDDHAVV